MRVGIERLLERFVEPLPLSRAVDDLHVAEGAAVSQDGARINGLGPSDRTVGSFARDADLSVYSRRAGGI